MNFVYMLCFLNEVSERTKLQIKALKKSNISHKIITLKEMCANGINQKSYNEKILYFLKRIDYQRNLKFLKSILIIWYIYLVIKRLKKFNLNACAIQINHPMLLVVFPFLQKSKANIFYDCFEYYALVYKDLGLLGRIYANVCSTLEKQILPKINGVFCVSSENNWLKNTLRKLNQNSIELNNYPSRIIKKDRINFERTVNLQPGKKIIVYAGGLKSKKGIETLPDIVLATIKKNKNCRFLIIGSIACRITPEEWLKRKNIIQYCSFVSWISQDELHWYLSDSHVGLILMSPKSAYRRLGEGGGRKLFTYMKAGLPVIAPSFGKSWNIVTESGIGVQVDTTSAEETARAIIKILKDESERNAMAARSRKLFEEKYNWETQEMEYLSHLGF